MSEDTERAVPELGAARHDQHASKDTEPRSASKVARGVAPVADLARYREMRKWATAATWLNSCGFAAAVPADLVGPLTRRGLIVWGAGREDVA
jgi:hypothetical protein